MAKCAGCGNEISANSRFCPVCGRPSGPAPAAGPPPYSPPATGGYEASAESGNGKMAAIIGGGVLLVLIAAFLLIKASGILGAKKTEAPATAVLNAPPTQVVSAPVLAAPTAPPAAPGNAMPADVVDYLRWLKQFESARRDLENREATQLKLVAIDATKEFATGAASLGTLDDDPTAPAPAANGAAKSGLDFRPIDATIQQWNQAASAFQSKTPPEPCAPLATSYNGALTTGVQQMSGIASSFRSALSSLKSSNGQTTPDVTSVLTSLESEKSSHSGSQSIDAMYSDADAALDNLRAKYSSVPADIDGSHFSIKEEASSGGLGLGL